MFNTSYVLMVFTGIDTEQVTWEISVEDKE
jgi:hypothetical protein